MFTTGQPVVMYKQLCNRHDANAIMVHTAIGEDLGWVPKDHNRQFTQKVTQAVRTLRITNPVDGRSWCTCPSKAIKPRAMPSYCSAIYCGDVETHPHFDSSC